MPKQLKIAVAAAVVLVLGVSAQATVASWRAEGEVDAGQIKTGSLKLLLGSEGQNSQSLRWSELDSSNLVPGAFSQAPLNIINSGTVDLSYNLSSAVNAAANPSAADQALAQSSVLSIYSGMSAESCAADAVLAGQQLYSGPLNSNISLVQQPVLPANAGEASAQSLCVRLTVPSGAPQSAAGGKLDLVFNFVGQQQ